MVSLIEQHIQLCSYKAEISQDEDEGEREKNAHLQNTFFLYAYEEAIKAGLYKASFFNACIVPSYIILYFYPFYSRNTKSTTCNNNKRTGEVHTNNEIFISMYFL